MGDYRTHQGCSGEVAAALSGLLRLNSAAQQQQEEEGPTHVIHCCRPATYSSPGKQAIIVTEFVIFYL